MGSGRSQVSGVKIIWSWPTTAHGEKEFLSIGGDDRHETCAQIANGSERVAKRNRAGLA